MCQLIFFAYNCRVRVRVEVERILSTSISLLRDEQTRSSLQILKSETEGFKTMRRRIIRTCVTQSVSPDRSNGERH